MQRRHIFCTVPILKGVFSSCKRTPPSVTIIYCCGGAICLGTLKSKYCTPIITHTFINEGPYF